MITVVGHADKPPYTFLDKVTEAVRHGALLIGGVSVAIKGATVYWSQAVFYIDAHSLHLPNNKTE